MSPPEIHFYTRANSLVPSPRLDDSTEKRCPSTPAFVQGLLKAVSHQEKLKLPGHGSNSGCGTSGSKIQKIRASYPAPPVSLRYRRGSSSITSTDVMQDIGLLEIHIKKQ